MDDLVTLNLNKSFTFFSKKKHYVLKNSEYKKRQSSGRLNKKEKPTPSYYLVCS